MYSDYSGHDLAVKSAICENVATALAIIIWCLSCDMRLIMQVAIMNVARQRLSPIVKDAPLQLLQ